LPIVTVQVGAKALPIIIISQPEPSVRTSPWHGRQVASAALRCSRHTPCCIATMRRSPAINRAIGLSRWRPSGIYTGRFVEKLGNLPSCRGSGGGRRIRGGGRRRRRRRRSGTYPLRDRKTFKSPTRCLFYLIELKYCRVPNTQSSQTVKLY
jgi:hypothetical protein